MNLQQTSGVEGVEYCEYSLQTGPYDNNISHL